MTKRSARVQSISVSFGTDNNADQLIITHQLLAYCVSSASFKLAPGLRVSPEAAGYCTRIIIKLFVISQIILTQTWIEKECNCVGMQK